MKPSIDSVLARVGVLLLIAAGCHDPRDISVLEPRQDRERDLAKTNPAWSPQTDVRVASNQLAVDNSRGTEARPAPAPIQCARGGMCRQLSAPISSGVDLLFVVDNSGSMRVRRVTHGSE